MNFHYNNPAEPKAHDGIKLGPLADSLGYILKRAQLVISDDLVRALESVDLRPTYYSVLVIVGENPGLNQSEVSSVLGIQRTNFVTMVDDLEHRGLLARRPAQGDRRSYALHLTAEGETLLAHAHDLQEKQEERLSTKLGPDGRDLLHKLLWKLVY